jgi:hypothetical protein
MTRKENVSQPPLPPFRSVAMSVPAPSLRQPSEALQQKSSPFLSSPPPSLIKQPFKHEQTSTSNMWIWKVSQLSPVPIYHPLEKTSFSSTEPVDTITKRISTFLKAHSIQCTYDKEQQGRVDCSTDGLLHFVIQLWSKKDATIIEIQRRQGCCIAMHGLRTEITQAIQHGVSPPTTTEQQQQQPFYQRSCGFLQQLPLPAAQPQDCLEHCLDFTLQLLNSDLLDQNRLGLESLIILTDPTKVLLTSAQEISLRVLQDSSFQRTLIKFFFSANSMETDMHDYMNGALKLLAFKVMVHALETVTNNNSSNQKLSLDNDFWKTVLQCGYDNIHRFQERPIEACLSVRCLRLLQPLSTTMVFQQQPQLGESLRQAHEFGRQHNHLLQTETEMLMNVH